MTKRTESRDAVRVCMRMMIGRLAACAAAACALILAGGAAGGNRAVNELAKLTDPNGHEWDHFGSDVAVDGDVVVVGDPSWPWGTYPGGTAFVYRYDGKSWVLEARLEPSDPAYAECFGFAVAIDGDTILVGDYCHLELGNAAGAAYIFTFDGSEWAEEAKLLASDGAGYDRFGYAVAVAGDVAVIGSPRDDDLGSSSGSVYVFRGARDVWEETAKLHASNGQADYCFGCTVAISGDRFIAGGTQKYGDGTAGYVFRFDGESWIEEAILLPEEVIPDDGYAVKVDIDRDVAVVGAREGNGVVEDSGAVYVFRHDGSSWLEEAKLFAADGGEDDSFGAGLSVEGDTVVVGARRDDDNGDLSGSAYVFIYDRAEWMPHSKLLPSDGAPDQNFGCRPSISGDAVIVGAPGDAGHGENSGAAYVFSASQFMDCNNNGVPDYIDIADGTSEDCNENRVPDECDIANGTSEDCNENAIPDECDIADLTSWDCNQNGIPDECDIASGYSEDVNGDGIADECWFPGEAGVVPLLQERTLWVAAICWTPPCEDEDSDAATDFSLYNSAISASCLDAYSIASQQSVVERRDVWADGGLDAHGVAQVYECGGYGENLYGFTFGVPYAQSMLLRGRLFAFAGLYASSQIRLVVLGPDGATMLEEELFCSYEQSMETTLCEVIQCQEMMEYTLKLQAGADAAYGAGVEFTIQLTALGDVDGDWDVDTADLLGLLAAWGPNEGHPADFNGDGTVNTTDLLALLGNWGP